MKHGYHPSSPYVLWAVLVRAGRAHQVPVWPSSGSVARWHADLGGRTEAAAGDVE